MTSVVQAYDPKRASALARCWINEVVNGKDGDFGDSEFLCLAKEDGGQFLSSYQWRGGPSIGMCHQTETCGWQAPWGVRQKCSAGRPWLFDGRQFKHDKHYQLQEVMGLDKAASAADGRPLASTMWNATEPYSRDGRMYTDYNRDSLKDDIRAAGRADVERAKGLFEDFGGTLRRHRNVSLILVVLVVVLIAVAWKNYRK